MNYAPEHTIPDTQLDPSMLLRPAQACEWLGVGRSTLFELIASGSLASVKVGRARRISVSALRSYVAGLENQ